MQILQRRWPGDAGTHRRVLRLQLWEKGSGHVQMGGHVALPPLCDNVIPAVSWQLSRWYNNNSMFSVNLVIFGWLVWRMGLQTWSEDWIRWQQIRKHARRFELLVWRWIYLCFKGAFRIFGMAHDDVLFTVDGFLVKILPRNVYIR